MSAKAHVYVGPYFECDDDRGTGSLGDIAEAVGGALCGADGSAGGVTAVQWLPNANRPGWPREFGVAEIEGALPLAEDAPAKEKAWLAGAFVEEVAVLGRFYRQVQIRWGVVRWWS